ncbi:hypothetical protein [Pirellulimonas nuda]|uniref:hypothetical protein n=1 Tax=Pirellulimonas nuda TaxID=2528009 RepID=UPI0011A0BE4E|nr:hypothetical protein [Pirellulimonas nuda]
MLIATAAPAFLAVLASLWPLERIALVLTCTLLGLCTFVPFLFGRSRRHWFAGVTTIAVLLSVATSNWPLRAAYALSRSSFDRVASEVRAGELPKTPCSIGFFRIRKAEVHHNGIVCLWTNDDPSGPTGFVETGTDDLPFNLWSHVSLDNSWQFISED